MFRFTKPSIRSLLLLITLVVALPAGSIIVFSGIRFRQAMLDDAASETLKLADRIATGQQNLVVGAQQLMTALAQLPMVKDRDTAQVEPILRDLKQLNPMYSNIFIADREGTVWASAVPVPPPLSWATGAISGTPWRADSCPPGNTWSAGPPPGRPSTWPTR